MGDPSLGERALVAYWIDISPVGLNTQPASAGVPSSRMKEIVGVDSSDDSVDTTRPITSHKYLSRFESNACS